MANIHNFGSRTSADQVLAGRDLAGRVFIVTGANVGIGYETARALAGAGARVIFACRSAEKGNAAVAQAQAAHPGCKAEFIALDLSSFGSIREFCASFDAPTLDGLICNAGLYASGFSTTTEGIELTVGVCHFGHFLLTHLLIDKLKAAKGRVVMVASESHRMPPRLDFNRFPMTADNFKAIVAYGQAKLCNVLFANQLQRRYAADGITACSLHPGTLVTTNIAHDSPLARIAIQAVSLFTKNANQGASTSVLCATWPDADYIAGRYFSDCRPKKFSKEAGDPAVAGRLWELSERMCELSLA